MEQQYLDVLRAAHGGNRRMCRNGETRAIFAVQLRHDMRRGFPLLTTKRMPFKTILSELLWFIEAGRNSPVPHRLSNVRLREILGLAPDARTIWTLNSEEAAWLKKAKFPGDCGRIYGSQWRNWNGKDDQISNLIKSIKSDPASRYHKVVAWQPSELSEMCLPPCHGDFQCFIHFDENGKKLLSLHMVQRSCDLFLGVPFNIASYGCLLLMLAQLTGTIAHELVLTLNDAHVYEAHVQAVETQLSRVPHPLPRLELEPSVQHIDDFRMEHFKLSDYRHDETITAPLL
jgi:thymidylate synthase